MLSAEAFIHSSALDPFVLRVWISAWSLVISVEVVEEEEVDSFNFLRSSSFSLSRAAKFSFAAAIQASAAEALLLSCSISVASLLVSAALIFLSESISDVSFSTAASRFVCSSVSAALASTKNFSALAEFVFKMAISELSVSVVEVELDERVFLCDERSESNEGW